MSALPGRFIIGAAILAICLAGVRHGSAAPENPGCGAAAVYFVLRCRDIAPGSLAEVSQRVGEANDASSTVAGLKAGLARYGVEAEARELTLAQLLATDQTAILLIETPRGPHFVVFGGMTPERTQVRLISPPDTRDMTVAEFQAAWKGAVLLMDAPAKTGSGPLVRTAGALSCADARQYLGRFVRPVTKQPEAIFHVRNTSQDAMDLGTPVTSCGCTSAKVEQGHLLPGQETRVVCRVQDTNSNEAGIKKFSVTIPQGSGAPLLLNFSAEFVQSVDVRPGRLYFGEALRRELPEARTIALSPGSAGSGDIHVISTAAAVPWIAVTAVPGGVAVALKPEAPLGPFSQVVTIETSAGAVNVPVSGEVLGAIQATPNPVILPATSAEGAVTLRLVRTPGSTCDLARLRYVYDTRKLALEPDVSADEVRIHVRSTQEAAGPMSYPIRIIDSATNEELTVCAVRFGSRG